MPKETSKKKFSLQNGDLALTVAGTSIGSVTPFLLREYVDSYAPEGVWPGVIPIEWGRPSVLGSVGLGVACLIGGVVFKSLRFFLLPLGIASTSVGLLMGVFPTPPSSAIRLVQTTSPGRLKSASPARSNVNIKLRSVGNPGKSVEPGVPANYNPRTDIIPMRNQHMQSLKPQSQDVTDWEEFSKAEVAKVGWPLRG